VSQRPVLLVGSVPLASAREVFAAAATRLGTLASCLPDGETGDRLTWTGWQNQRLRSLDGLEVIQEFPFGGHVQQTVAFFAPAEGVQLANLSFGPLGYAEVARASYTEFTRLKDTGVIASATRFQVSLPSPGAIATFFAHRAPETLDALEGAFASEVADIVRAIPPQELAIQWDLAIETQDEEARRHPGRHRLGRERLALPMDTYARSLAKVANRVPPEALLGLHTCFGDPDGQHLIQPEDTTVPVDLATDLLGRICRGVDWIHVPVPIDRADDAYFAPLAHLTLPPEARLYLGVVHLADGVEGAATRIQAASAHLSGHLRGFGIATECGLGRQDPADVSDLLDLHRAIAQRVR
jgi:hypothetical protein